MNAPDSHEAVETDVRWTDEASKRLERAPLFLRGMVRRVAEKKARELGCMEISGDLLDQFKSQMMGGMGGESGMADAVEQMAQGRIPWTASAKERLNTVPEFMRHMIKQIAEEIAKERGH
ncbi:MAG TPA: PCP reductase family protein, partial [Nitrospiraceae bacterium]|nr:PCP reductase family protein [Nitrospiraceae bacterium]